MTINLVCPKCEQQTVQSVNESQPYHQLTCPKCQIVFNTWLAKVRAKNSRQDKRSNTRNYSVRVIEADGRERLIQFQQSGISDFELRSGDLAAFSYINNTLLVVQNLNVSQYLS